jgi:GT2 family glycosyltransferase
VSSICVEVAVKDDPRLLAALESLAHQSRRPDRVLVAAATTTPESLLAEVKRRFANLPLDTVRYPGGVVAARSASLERVTEEITAFLDSDEVAPPGWLASLIEPLESGTVAFSGGPTRPLHPPVNSVERYNVALEESIYRDLVPSRISYLPLQNSAWRTEELKRLGFDPRIPFAEDHDLETRAIRAGLRGEFVPEAWVYHDQGDVTTFLRWVRKRYRYLTAMAMSLTKNGELRSRLREQRAPVRHPLRLVEAALKPFALIEARLRWWRLERTSVRA